MDEFNNSGVDNNKEPLQQNAEQNQGQWQNQEQRPLPPNFNNNQSNPNSQYQQGYGQQPNQPNQFNPNNQYQQGFIPQMPPPVFLSPKQIAKKALKKDANKTSGLLLIIQAGGNTLAMIIMVIIGAVLGVQMAGDNVSQMEISRLVAEKLEEFTTVGGMGMFLTSVLPIFLASTILVLISRKWFKISLRRDLFTKPQQSKKIFLLAPLAIMGAGAIGAFITQIYLNLFEKAGIEIFIPDFSFAKDDMLGSILMVVYVCILAPLTEEIIFRGFILKANQKHGDLYAIILSSILFSLFHMNLQQFIFPFVMGLLLGFITVKTRSIIPAIVCHMFNNSFSMATQYFVAEKKLVGEIVPSIITIISILVFVVFVIIYAKEMKSISRGDTTFMKTGKKLALGFTSAWSIVFIVIFAFNILIPILSNAILGAAS